MGLSMDARKVGWTGCHTMRFSEAATGWYEGPSMSVSVIIPCFNHARYVEQCLTSVDAQDADLDVIVIDDGSTDETWERISSFRWRQGRKVRTFRTPNRGA